MQEWQAEKPTQDGWYWTYGWAGAGWGWRYREDVVRLQMVRLKDGQAYIGTRKVKESVAYWLGPISDPPSLQQGWHERDDGRITLTGD